MFFQCADRFGKNLINLVNVVTSWPKR
jgi:hypothetical protein